MSDFVSAACEGEVCRCGRPAANKIGEEIMFDDPLPHRHNLTAYVCRACFDALFRPHLRPTPDSGAEREAVGVVEWKRAGNMLYTLEQIGWRRGQPVEQNRLMVTVTGGPNATAEELEALIKQIRAALPTPPGEQEAGQ